MNSYSILSEGMLKWQKHLVTETKKEQIKSKKSVSVLLGKIHVRICINSRLFTFEIQIEKIIDYHRRIWVLNSRNETAKQT